MKKLIYTILLLLSVSLTIVSCTEETVAPKTEEGNNSVDKGM